MEIYKEKIMVKQNKRVVANTVITREKNIIKKAESDLVDLKNAELDLTQFIADHKKILASYEETNNGKQS